MAKHRKGRSITEADLAPWNDPLDILDALVRLRKEQLPGLRSRLQDLISHKDTDVRVHAMRSLFVHLKDRENHSDALVALERDPDAEVRRVAAYAVASTSSEATRSDDIKTLIRRLSDLEEQLPVRGAAYEALLLLHDRKDFPPVKKEIDLSTDVDWQWIKSLRYDWGV